MQLLLNRLNEKLGKYAVLNLRRLREKCSSSSSFDEVSSMEVFDAVRVLDQAGLLEWGVAGSVDEFFLIKLRDIHSQPALLAYASSASTVDVVYGREIQELASRSGHRSPYAKLPD